MCVFKISDVQNLLVDVKFIDGEKFWDYWGLLSLSSQKIK